MATSELHRGTNAIVTTTTIRTIQVLVVLCLLETTVSSGVFPSTGGPSPNKWSTVEPQSHHGRLNTKHLNQLFKRFSALVHPSTTDRDDRFLATTLDPLHREKLSHLNQGTVQYRQIDLQTSAESNATTATTTTTTTTDSSEQPPVSHTLSNAIEVSLTNETLTHADSVTVSYRTMATPPSTTTVSPIDVSSHTSTMSSFANEFDAANFITAPTDQCKCVCRNGFKLEAHDIRLEELQMKLLQAELLTENKQSTFNNKPKIEDVLDSLVDEDESDYDDIDELEQIQRPTKYIPMEIIELSHRRPPRKPSNEPSKRPTTSTTSTPSPLSLVTNVYDTLSTAPLYSMSFTKPVNTIKTLATRMAQLGIPLLATVALGNALMQVELIDRSVTDETPGQSKTANHANVTGPLVDYWNPSVVPIAGGHLPTHGYYGPFYDSVTPVYGAMMPGDDSKPGQKSSKRKKFKWTKKPDRKESTNSPSLLKRWIERWRS